MTEMPHLLLVDDERSIREPLATFLGKHGFRVTQAGDAASARTRLGAYAIDLVILDVMMPGEDGLSLCRHIRETSEVPVILLTARSEETDRIVGLEMGAGRLCRKAVLAARTGRPHQGDPAPRRRGRHPPARARQWRVRLW